MVSKYAKQYRILPNSRFKRGADLVTPEQKRAIYEWLEKQMLSNLDKALKIELSKKASPQPFAEDGDAPNWNMHVKID